MPGMICPLSHSAPEDGSYQSRPLSPGTFGLRLTISGREPCVYMDVCLIHPIDLTDVDGHAQVFQVLVLRVLPWWRVHNPRVFSGGMLISLRANTSGRSSPSCSTTNSRRLSQRSIAFWWFSTAMRNCTRPSTQSICPRDGSTARRLRPHRAVHDTVPCRFTKPRDRV